MEMPFFGWTSLLTRGRLTIIVANCVPESERGYLPARQRDRDLFSVPMLARGLRTPLAENLPDESSPCGKIGPFRGA